MPGSTVTTWPSSITSVERGPSRGDLVDVEADAVAQPVPELLAVAGLRDHRGGDLVCQLAGHAGLDALLGHLLRREHDVVDRAELHIGVPPPGVAR